MRKARDIDDGFANADKTGYHRNFAIDPYEGYYRIGSLMFPVGKVRSHLPAKERIGGVAVGDAAKAYVLENLHILLCLGKTSAYIF